jgi:hypothetical protein
LSTFFNQKMFILPRQTRDKHRENSRKCRVLAVRQRDKPSAVGTVIKKHESMPMVQVDFSESGGEKFKWMQVADLEDPSTNSVAASSRESMADDDGLASALAGAKLRHYEDALRELGCVMVGDLVRGGKTQSFNFNVAIF